MNYEVSKCEHCPLYTRIAQYDYQYCKHPKGNRSVTMAFNLIDECPIKQEPITITLKQDADTTRDIQQP